MPSALKTSHASLLVVIALVLIAVTRIALTYTVLSHTTDEPSHIGAGMQWLDKGIYTYEVLHPPLARVAVAVGPFLAGIRPFEETRMLEQGEEILYAHGAYFRNLTLARLGVLPFFVFATFLVWIFAKVLFGDTAAVFAVVFFTTTPTVLAHAGLATTDFPFTALCLASLFALDCWLERPTFLRSLLLGLSTGLAVLAKFSALVFLPACGIPMIAVYWLEKGRRGNSIYSKRWLISVGVSAVVVCVVVWAGYRFSLSPLRSTKDRPYQIIDRVVGTNGALHDLAYAATEMKIPAPEFFKGIREVTKKNQRGH